MYCKNGSISKYAQLKIGRVDPFFIRYLNQYALKITQILVLHFFKIISMFIKIN